MMTPEDVMLEAMNVVKGGRDSIAFRKIQCEKLRSSIREFAIFYMKPQYDESRAGNG